MKTFTLVWKKLVIGIIAVFLSMALIPVTESLPIEKEQSMMTRGCSDGIILNGTMGQNNWYISPVTITFATGNRTFLKIDGGGWSEYTVPIVIDTEGFHEVWWYYIDEHGNQSSIYSTSFKIDMTPPTITITKHRIGLFKYSFTINVSDNTSGVVLLEFYLDDALVGTVTVLPWVYVMEVFGNHAIKVIAYDAAGLNGSDSASTSCSLIYVQQSTISDTPILPPIDRTYFIGQIHNLTIEGNDYHFESTNIRKFGFWRYSIRSWGFSYDHYRGHYSCGWGGAEFHGLLKPDFIWGYFTFLQQGQAESN
ncbi:MAG TPA: hypothetical protein VN377_02245 [Candidatus Thermoplasmatota archaeon]|nr:hypothetical protein [Candidatus Thermoplasmatota archaeon]